MKSYMNEYTHEYWRGNEDRSKAPDYVFTKPAGGGAPFLLYYGRIDGVNFSEIEAMKNQKALKKLHDEIIMEVCSRKYLSEIGKKGGAKISESKKKSSAENGKKGGRPRYTHLIRDREAGNVIDKFTSLEAAENELKKYEEDDKAEGTYTKDFYEIVKI